MTWGSGRCSKLGLEVTGKQRAETRETEQKAEGTEGQEAVSTLLGPSPGLGAGPVEGISHPSPPALKRTLDTCL